MKLQTKGKLHRKTFHIFSNIKFKLKAFHEKKIPKDQKPKKLRKSFFWDELFENFSGIFLTV